MATKIIAWNTGTGNITLTYQGQGDGTISIQLDANNLGSARSQVITVETVGGAITRDFTINQAACPFPVGDVKNFSYTGSYQEVELPAGQYKLQCWGAQGGSNSADSSYGITSQVGGKGGYSEGVLTLTQATTLKVYVGGQGSSTTGGFNGGGTSSGASSKNADGEIGYTRMGGGGGATDIRLSDGALLSRMIVAGGGSGGAMCFRRLKTSYTDTKTIVATSYWGAAGILSAQDPTWVGFAGGHGGYLIDVSSYRGYNCAWSYSQGTSWAFLAAQPVQGQTVTFATGSSYSWSTSCNMTVPDDAIYLYIYAGQNQERVPSDIVFTKTITTTTEDWLAQPGFYGGGTEGGAVTAGTLTGQYNGKQNEPGLNGAWGEGASNPITTWRYASAGGGGGWYGGGYNFSNVNMNGVQCTGGGSGFVNTAASAGNRPSGYTGLQLDSGETKAGNTSFPKTSGSGNETGHSGNGYARITRLT